ncbi:MAG: glycine zipper 2TM domain-containing protein, partial [Alphaproteobacteria bacterium]|nr:glycine zipper 2TM domain-containing protein [Alphaproteobacteria bacterium]
VGAAAANAGCEGRKTTGTVVGAGAGGVLGNVVTHGSVVGTLGGAALGGFAGHRIASDNCHKTAYVHHYRHYSYRDGRKGYYDRDGRWHYV